MKKLICVSLVLFLFVSLCACDAAEEILEFSEKVNAKTFTEGELSIDLTRDFLRMDILAEGFDFAMSDGDITIFGERMDYSQNDQFTLSAWEYAEAIREGLKMRDSDMATEVTDLDGIPTIQYTVLDDDGEKMTFLYAIYEATDAFWLVQFGFETEDYEEYYPLAQQYARSVVINNQ